MSRSARAVALAERPAIMPYTVRDPIVTPNRLEKSRQRAPGQRGAQRLAKWLGLRESAGNLEIFVACENQRCAHAFADADRRAR